MLISEYYLDDILNKLYVYGEEEDYHCVTMYDMDDFMVTIPLTNKKRFDLELFLIKMNDLLHTSIFENRIEIDECSPLLREILEESWSNDSGMVFVDEYHATLGETIKENGNIIFELEKEVEEKGLSDYIECNIEEQTIITYSGVCEKIVFIF